MQQDERLRLAEEFLQEAVYQARSAQAAGTFLARGARPDAGACGLGEGAGSAREGSTRALELHETLFGTTEQAPARRALVDAWVETQDALDRKRNHFLKAFRLAHGFDRNAYSDVERAEFESGLQCINAEVENARRAAALRLLT
jgi:hypothetical protein